MQENAPNPFRCLILFMTALLFALPALTVSFATPAQADRCSVDGSGNMSCSAQYRVNWYSCNGIPFGRGVRWQVPEGTPPSGGWPVAFFYNGTTPADLDPFAPSAAERLIAGLFGIEWSPEIIHELLDDPSGSGIRYAVVAPEPPQAAIALEFWNTNIVFPYTVSCDYDFFPDLFSEIKGGKYGSSSQFDMGRRYAYGISSGGYNTSRMAVNFNQKKKWYQSCSGWCNEDTWKALAIIAASYATCNGPLCNVPSNLPSNHPPTKFWHGTSDLIVGLWTAEDYDDELQDDQVDTDFVVHGGGHELNSTMVDASGIKAWFDAHPN
jgi:hypothetical protein